jgi:hypothetical protein
MLVIYTQVTEVCVKMSTRHSFAQMGMSTCTASRWLPWTIRILLNSPYSGQSNYKRATLILLVDLCVQVSAQTESVGFERSSGRGDNAPRLLGHHFEKTRELCAVDGRS